MQEIERAVMGAQRAALPELSLALWRAHAAGAIGDDDAQRIAELIQARKVASVTQSNDYKAVTSKRRNCGSRPRSPASMERRRAWSAGSWMPPVIAARFTLGEAAALAVVLREVALRGACELHVGSIAALAGVSETTARNARRQAQVLGLVAVEVRRVAYDRNLPNRITVVSRELSLWLRTRARVDRQGWVQNPAADPQPLIPYLSSVAATAPIRASRGAGDAGGGLPGPRSPAVTRESAPERLGGSHRRFGGRRLHDTFRPHSARPRPEVWVADMPDHMIHYNGDRFLGPR